MQANPNIAECNYCEAIFKAKDDESDDSYICKRHLCNCCGECEGILFSFGDHLDFDLCDECLSEIYHQMQKGLLRLDQDEKEIDPENIPEKIEVIRKTITEDERKAIFDRDGWKCVKCGSSEYLQIDHIFPFSKGGTTEKSNLQTLCKKCNSKKRNNVT